MVPVVTDSQLQYRIFSFFWSEVDVWQPSSSQVGFWSDLNLFLGLVSSYTYIDTNDASTPVLEARKPFGFFLGQRFQLWRCGSSEVEYRIEEDYWAGSFNPFNPSHVFSITDSSGKVVATSQQKLHDAWEPLQNSWEATITSPNGTEIATLTQASRVNTGAWGYRKWHVTNQRPDLLPSEVVSFMAAVWDIDKS